METKVAAVSMRGVTKTFGAVIANEDVDLDIYKGEILALLGENGSGKTTLMNMLSGIYHPDKGNIYIAGKPEAINLFPGSGTDHDQWAECGDRITKGRAESGNRYGTPAF